jgi:hypothetical protein
VAHVSVGYRTMLVEGFTAIYLTIDDVRQISLS